MAFYLLFVLCWSCSAIPTWPVDVNSTTATPSPSFTQNREKRAPVLSSGAAAAIIAGVSLGTTTASQLAAGLQGQGFTVGVVIEIENYTKWPLSGGQSWTKWGYVKNTIQTIDPGTKEAWQAHKTKGTVVGSAGIISYKINGLDEYIAIVWHAPYNFNHLSNVLAVGVYKKKNWDAVKYWSTIYDKMINKDLTQTEYLGYPDWPGCRDLYYYSTNVCSTYSPNVQVDATMGTSHHPTISIKVHARSASNNFVN